MLCFCGERVAHVVEGDVRAGNAVKGLSAQRVVSLVLDTDLSNVPYLRRCE